jgi:AcrR family transcriptional regulator
MARRIVDTAVILQTALELFSRKGYSETKMTDIARIAGLSVGALYLRFRNKEQLCLELIRDQTRDYERLTDNVVKSSPDPVQALRSYITFCIGYSLEKKQLITLLYREHRLHFLKPLRNKFLRRQQKLIETMLLDGMAKKRVRPLDAGETALMIFGCIRGAIMLKLIFAVGTPGELGDSLCELISSGIGSDRS